MKRLFDILNKDALKVLKKIDFSNLNGKSILITGASGLMGVNIISTLKLVTQKIKNITIYPIIFSEPNIFLAELFSFSGITYFRGDITDEQFCKSLPNADYIIHAAGYAQPLRFMADPLKTFKLNTSSTILLFEKLLPNGKFLYISSSEVYHGLEGKKFSETEIGNTNTTHPRACYIEGKKGGETICNAYRQIGVDAKSIRLSLVYGPGTRKDDKRVLSAFIVKALNGEIKLLDGGEAKRTYCYITDANELLWKILFWGKEPLYNVGGHSNITIIELAELIGGFLKVPIILPDKSETISGAPKDVQLDLSLIENEFNKREFVELHQGLENTINWYRNLEQYF